MSENISELTDLLRKLIAVNSDIEGSAIVSVQGLPICSVLNKSTNDGIVSAMSAAIQSVSERAVEELDRGELKRILIEGLNGSIILSKAGENAILCTLCSANSSWGMVFLNIQSVSNRIAALLD